MNKFYKIHTVTADEHDIGKGLFTYSDFSIRLIAIYLSGKQNLRQIVETWLSAGEEYFTNKECNDKNSNYEICTRKTRDRTLLYEQMKS